MYDYLKVSRKPVSASLVVDWSEIKPAKVRQEDMKPLIYKSSAGG